MSAIGMDINLYLRLKPKRKYFASYLNQEAMRDKPQVHPKAVSANLERMGESEERGEKDRNQQEE